MSLSVEMGEPESHGATAGKCSNYQTQISLYVLGTRAYSSSTGYGSRSIHVTADKAIKRVYLARYIPEKVSFRVISNPIYDLFKSPEPIYCGQGTWISSEYASSNGDRGTSYPRVVIYNGDTREVIGDRTWFTWGNIDTDKFYVDIDKGKYTSKIIIEYRIPYFNASSYPPVEYSKITSTVIFYKDKVTEDAFDFVDTSISSDITFNNVKTLHGYKCIPDKYVSISYYAESEVTPPTIFQVNIDRQVIFDKQSWGHYTYEGVINSDSFREMTAWLFVANESTQGYYTNSDSVYTHYPIEIKSTQGRITKCKMGEDIDCITEYKNAPPSNYMSPTITSDLGISNIINDYANKRYIYTVSASKCGKYSIDVDIEDNLDDENKRHAIDTQYIQVYQPPETKITVDDDTPDIGQTIKFKNNSVEAEGSTCRYDWYINQERKYSDKSKDFSLDYYVNSPNKFLVSIVGYDTAEPSETSSSNTILINPNSPIPDFKVRCTTSLVYASIPATFYIDTEKHVPGIIYTWEVNNVPKGTGESIVYTPTDTGKLSVTATATYLGVTESNTYSTIVQSPAPLVAFTYEPTKNIIRGFTDVTLDNKSAPVEGTTPTYTWYVNDSVVVPVDNKIKLYKETNVIKLTGTVSGFSSSYETDPIPTISPAPTLNLTLSKDSASTGDTVTCNSNIVPLSGTTVQIRWYINNVPEVSYNNQDVIDYTVPNDTYSDIDIRVEAWATSSPGDISQSSKTLRIVRYKDPIKRFVVCIYNDNIKENEWNTWKPIDQMRYFTRDGSSPDRYTNLSFETRLNETGGGSLDILIDKTTEDDTLLTSGNSIIIFDDFLPVYTGVITSVSNTNICVSGKSDIMKKEMYTIKFDEGCRKLSYIQSKSQRQFKGTLVQFRDSLIPKEYRGYCSITHQQDYFTFSISYQDILSQLDSFGEQNNIRYKTRPNVYRTSYSDSTLTNNNTVIRFDKKYSNNMPKGTLLLLYTRFDEYAVGRVTRDFSSGNQDVYIQILDRDPLSISGGKLKAVSFFTHNPLIDLKNTYYEEESVFPINDECKSDDKSALIINKTCLDVSDVDNLNKHYGTISVSSPQFGIPNRVNTMKLTIPINEDNSLQDGAWYVNNPFDYVITKVEQTSAGFYNVTVKGSVQRFIESLGTEEPLYYIVNPADNIGKSVIWKTENSENFEYTSEYSIIHSVQLNPADAQSFVGHHMFSRWIPISPINNRSYGETSYSIGGVNFDGTLTTGTPTFYKIVSDEQIRQETVILQYLIDDSFGFVTGQLLFPLTPWNNSPYLLYPNKTLSVTAQSNMTSADLAVIASNIARLGSNFTATVTGTCNINKFVDKYDSFPSVGSHVALYYDDGSAVKIGSTNYNEYYHDYELQSYKIDTQKMTVDFNFGIKPINIGDVIYRLSQNMTTNILNN